MSTLKVDTIQNSSGVDKETVYAWCSWNNTGTIAIRYDVGISSLTDRGTGTTELTLDHAVSAAEKLATVSNSFGNYTAGSSTCPNQFASEAAGQRTTTKIGASVYVGNFIDHAYNSMIAVGS